MAGPLSDIRIIELAGLGALLYGSLRLADMGAEVIRVERLADVLPSADRTPRRYPVGIGAPVDRRRPQTPRWHRNASSVGGRR